MAEKREKHPVFVVQEHDASRHHFDFRLEVEGVLKSWAVPKGPPEEPGEKRLAIMVEDHPLSYAGFEGTIPEGQYGAGTVRVWDHGTWEPTGKYPDPAAALQGGEIAFYLHGEKLDGEYMLLRMEHSTAPHGWLLIKKKGE